MGTDGIVAAAGRVLPEWGDRTGVLRIDLVSIPFTAIARKTEDDVLYQLAEEMKDLFKTLAGRRPDRFPRGCA